jgi:hypothetical protein
MKSPTVRRVPSRLIDGDIILSEAEIAIMGLVEAADDIGQSWQEIRQVRRMKEVGHG